MGASFSGPENEGRADGALPTDQLPERVSGAALAAAASRC